MDFGESQAFPREVSHCGAGLTSSFNVDGGRQRQGKEEVAGV